MASLPADPVTPKDDPTIWRADDALWARLAPLLVVSKPRKKPGRPRADDRPLFDGMIWVLRTGAQWSAVPRACGPKSTVHDRFQEGVQTGAFARAWTLLLEEYDEFVGLDLHGQSADGCLVKAPLGKKGGAEKPNGRAVTPPTAANAAPNAIC
jgi:putative transposase